MERKRWERTSTNIVFVQKLKTLQVARNAPFKFVNTGPLDSGEFLADTTQRVDFQGKSVSYHNKELEIIRNTKNTQISVNFVSNFQISSS